MKKRVFGRLGWRVSEVGYGTWGLAGGEGGWTGATPEQAMVCLEQAVEKGCNFFDTAWIYGRGEGERVLGQLLAQHQGEKLYVATKIPPKNRVWPSKRGDLYTEIFPRNHVRDYVCRSLDGLRVERIDLLQFHVWEDAWCKSDEWLTTVSDLKQEGLIEGIGISINRWEHTNVLATLRTGLIDAVQVIYNVFDQAPADELFPECKRLDVAVIARVPYDEGSLCGGLTEASSWPEGDWRNSYFVPENLLPTVKRVKALQADLPGDEPLASTALRFVLSSPEIATVIPGMRSVEHVKANMACSDTGPLPNEMLSLLSRHRWDRQPAWWSQ
ncbi:aldo/keto reductase [Alcaligenes faecalis]|uniref:aldo/keto reductase n=1 Tax=Alcaligenes faecalis TaxID=511 RepID=UPI0034D727C8